MRSTAFLLLIAAMMDLSISSLCRNRYGEPDLERFIARPGVAVSIAYSPDRAAACEVLIEPPRSLLGNSNELLPLMNSETVTSILDEVVPALSRGLQLQKAITAGGCNRVVITQYENMTITRSLHLCNPSQGPVSTPPGAWSSLARNHEVRAMVTLNNPVCKHAN